MIENQSKNSLYAGDRAMDGNQIDEANELFSRPVENMAFSFGNSRDVGDACKTPRVIELGSIIERHCYNGEDSRGDGCPAGNSR